MSDFVQSSQLVDAKQALDRLRVNMRVSIRGSAVQLPQDDALKSSWLARFPEQAINFELADFSFWRIVPRDARFVAGFGRIHNLSPAQLSAAAA